MRELDEERIEKLEPLIERAASDPRLAGAIDAVMEAMFLMAIADGDVSEVEVKEFARACRQLVGDLGEADLEGTFLGLAGAVEEDGWDRRVREVAKTLSGSGLSETAYRLAVAVALADDFVANEEAHAMDVFADALAIDPDRSHALLREVHEELFAPRILGREDV